MNKKMMIIAGMMMAAVSVQAYNLQLQWVPQCQFAGYYMAEKEGFYKDAGIDITVVPGGPGAGGLATLSSGDAEFATALVLAGLQEASKGDGLVNIAQVIQKPALVLLAVGGAGIDAPAAMDGKSVGVWPGDFQIPIRAFLKKEKVSGANVVDQGFSMDPFLMGKLDVASAMLYNEYGVVLDAGYSPDDLVVFNFADYGMSIPEDAVFVTAEFYKNNKDLCKKFAAATMKGWQYAFDHKEDTVAYVTGLANEGPMKTTESHQMFMLKQMEKLVDPANSSMSEKDFNTAVTVLKDSDLLTKPVDYSVFVAQ